MMLLKTLALFLFLQLSICTTEEEAAATKLLLAPSSQQALALTRPLASPPVDRQSSSISALSSSLLQSRSLLPLPLPAPLVASGSTAVHYSRHARDYQLHEILGKGSEGVVYRANFKLRPPTMAGKWVALKRFYKRARSSTRKPNWRNEYDVASTIPSHPNIMKPLALVQFYDGRRQPPNGFVNMAILYELMPLNLFILTKQSSPLPMRQIQSLMRDLLSGLDALHTQGLIHRDIKPENCLIDEQGRLKIADCGLATYIALDPQGFIMPMSDNVVTSWYRAPELCLGSRQYTGAVDIYAAGIMLWDLLHKTSLFSLYAEKDIACAAMDMLGTSYRFHFPQPHENHYIAQLPRYEETKSHCQRFWAPEWTHLSFHYGWRTTTPLGSYLRPLESPFLLGLHPIHKIMLDAGGPILYDLFVKMTSINEFARPSANQLLRHPFFSTQL